MINIVKKELEFVTIDIFENDYFLSLFASSRNLSKSDLNFLS